jgi:hypothetical protein
MLKPTHRYKKAEDNNIKNILSDIAISNTDKYA